MKAVKGKEDISCSIVIFNIRQLLMASWTEKVGNNRTESYNGIH